MKKNFSLLFVFFFVYLNMNAQDGSEKPRFSWSDKREIGLNITNLATRFIPLNFNNLSDQDIAFKYRKYRRTNAFKLDVGARISEDQSFDRQFLFFSTGVERRRNIWQEKWTYVSSYEFSILVGPNEGFVGWGKGYGIEYSLNSNVFLSTQTSISIGALIDDGFGIKFSPPNSIFLNIRF